VEEHGFAIIPAVLADRDISKLEQAFECAGVARSKAGVRHAFKHSAVAEVAHDERLLEIARRVHQPFVTVKQRVGSRRCSLPRDPV